MTENEKDLTFDTELTIQVYHWSAIFTVIHWLESHGSVTLRLVCLRKDGKKSRMGVPVPSSQNAVSLDSV